MLKSIKNFMMTINPYVFCSNAVGGGCALFNDYKGKNIKNRIVFFDCCWSSFRGTLAARSYLDYILPFVNTCIKKLFNYDIASHAMQAFLGKLPVLLKERVVALMNIMPIVLGPYSENLKLFFTIGALATVIAMYNVTIYDSDGRLSSGIQMIFSFTLSLAIMDYLSFSPILFGIFVSVSIFKMIISYCCSENERVPDKAIDFLLNMKEISKLHLIYATEKIVNVRLYNSKEKLFIDYFILGFIYLRSQFKSVKSWTDNIVLKLFAYKMNQAISGFESQEIRDVIKELLDNNTNKRYTKKEIMTLAGKIKNEKSYKREYLSDYAIISFLYLRTQSGFFASWTDFIFKTQFDIAVGNEIEKVTQCRS